MTEQTVPCWKREPHPPHRPWVTSTGGGHFLGDEEPDEDTKRTEKNVRQVYCPGVSHWPDPEPETASEPLPPIPLPTVLSQALGCLRLRGGVTVEAWDGVNHDIRLSMIHTNPDYPQEQMAALTLDDIDVLRHARRLIYPRPLAEQPPTEDPLPDAEECYRRAVRLAEQVESGERTPIVLPLAQVYATLATAEVRR